MPLGHGKYDDLATLVRERAEAEAVVVIVVDGKLGRGFSIQLQDPLYIPVLAETLLQVAKEIERVFDQFNAKRLGGI